MIEMQLPYDFQKSYVSEASVQENCVTTYGSHEEVMTKLPSTLPSRTWASVLIDTSFNDSCLPSCPKVLKFI